MFNCPNTDSGLVCRCTRGLSVRFLKRNDDGACQRC